MSSGCESSDGEATAPDPHTTSDPVVAAAHVVQALQYLVSRQSDPMSPTVITIGSIHGGDAPNAIPDAVELSGTVRT
jgi:hippurate hydrolase